MLGAMNIDLAGWVGIALPIVIGVATALLLTWYAVRKKPGA
ncbi:MAG: hypothetical protein WAU68_06220 [Vitreimonas sp.]